MRKGSRWAFRMKCTQFLTKSIITLLPKVKWTVVRRGARGARATLAGSLNARNVFSAFIQSGLTKVALFSCEVITMGAGGGATTFCGSTEPTY